MSRSLEEQRAPIESESLPNEELTIKVASSHFQESAMNDDQKKVARAHADSLYALFEKTLKENGEFDLQEISWNNEDELEMEFLSNVALNTFMLKAQELGKNIKYEKVLKVTVAD